MNDVPFLIITGPVIFYIRVFKMFEKSCLLRCRLQCYCLTIYTVYGNYPRKTLISLHAGQSSKELSRRCGYRPAVKSLGFLNPESGIVKLVFGKGVSGNTA
jgi:hypothetical protein